MGALIQYPLAQGGSAVVEVEESAPGVVPVASPGEMAAKAGETFEEALERIRPAVDVLVANLRALGDSPDGVEVEFGLNMSFDLGAFFAKTGTSANFKVTLTWKREASQRTP